MCSFIKCLFACCCPPIAVLIDRGCNCDFLLNIFLTLIGYFPGCIHAYCVICENRPEYPPPVNVTTIVNQQPGPQPTPIYIPLPQQQMPHQMYPMDPRGIQLPQMTNQQMVASAPPPPPAYYDNPSAPIYPNPKDEKFVA